MASPPPNIPPPAADSSSEPYPIGNVIGIVVGGAVGLVLLIFCIICAVCSCRRIRRRRMREHATDLEQPLDQLKSKRGVPNSPSMFSGKGALSTIKESELVVSHSIPADVDGREMLVMNGLVSMGSSGKLSPAVLHHSASANGRTQGAPAGGSNRALSILRWLESSELPHSASTGNLPQRLSRSGSSHPAVGAGAGGQPGQGGSLTHSPSMPTGSRSVMRSMLGRLDTEELADMRRRLLLAAGSMYSGDSAAQPLDVKGVVFARLPPSRLASPAPSVMAAGSVAESQASRQTRSKRAPESSPAPEQQALKAALTPVRSSLSRSSAAVAAAAAAATASASAPAVQIGSLGGVAFATIGSLSRSSYKGADPLQEAGMSPGSLPVSHNAPNLIVTSQFGSFRGSKGRATMASPPLQGGRLTYDQAVAVLEQASGTPAASSNATPTAHTTAATTFTDAATGFAGPAAKS